jgi:two-component system response regulator
MQDQLKKRILLVEDNPDDELLTLDALHSGGVKSQIDVARDGAEALDYVFRRGQFVLRDEAPPDLILLDLKLPKRSGHEVLNELRAREETRFTPVVVLTSSTEDEDIARSYAGGANSYIRKPVDFELFSAAVKSLGVYWLVYNQAPGQR